MTIEEKKEYILNGFKGGKIIKEDKERNEIILRSKEGVEWFIRLCPIENPNLIKISCHYLPPSKV